MNGGSQEAQQGGLSPDQVRMVEGSAGRDGAVPCPACGRPVLAGQEVVTSLGDVQQGVVGVTVHRRCFAAIGRPGLLELMVRASEQRGG
jgi:hypothetical protein